MKKLVFKWAVVLYIIVLPYVICSLSVPPADLPFFVALTVIAVCALWASASQPRKWRTVCIIALCFSVLAGVGEVVAGHFVKLQRERDNLRIHRASLSGKPFPDSAFLTDHRRA
jgi:hypothetical protein